MKIQVKLMLAGALVGVMTGCATVPRGDVLIDAQNLDEKVAAAAGRFK
jgi:hypothetical protein